MNRKMKAIFAIALCAFFLMSAFGAMTPVAAKDGSRTAVKKTVMGELFTATWCQYCPTATNSLSTIVNDTNYYPDRFTILEWHYTDTYAIVPAGPTRQTMFGVTGYPTTVIDGDSAGKIVGGQTVAVYKTAIDAKAANTGVNITISNVSLASNLMSADVIFEKVDTLAAGTYNARVFLVEDLKSTFSNSGGIGYMRHTVREDVYNQTLDLTDGMQHKVSLTSISVPASYDKYAVGLVAAYQTYAPGDKSIVQSRVWEFHNYPVPITATVGAKDFTMNEDTVNEGVDATTIFGADPEAQTVTYKLKSKATASHLLLTMNGTKVKVEPEANWFGSETFTVEADDGYAKNAQSIYEVAVTVASVNDAPAVVNAIADVKLKEGTFKTINLMDSGKEVFTDIEADAMTFTAVDLEPTPHMNVSVLGGANPAVKVTIPDGAAGKDTIQVTANDGKDTTNLTFKVEITDVNHNPTVKAKMGTVTFDEDTVYTAIGLDNVFTDFDGDKLTYDFWGAVKITVTANTTGEVTLTPAKDWSGSEVITFRATDTGTLNAVDELTASVNPVNDAPVIKKQLDDIEMDEDETTTLSNDAFSTLFSDVETSSDLLTYEVDGPKELILTVDDELVLTIEPEPNYFGEGTITITCSDGETPIEMSVPFTVVSVNDPVVIDTANVKPIATTPSIEEGKDLTFEVPAVDADAGATLKYVWSVDGDTQAGADESTFTFTPDKDMGGEKVKVSVTVSDGTGSEATYDWTVTVKDVNNKPALTVVSPEAKEYPAGAISLSATATDIDGDALTFSWFVDGTPVGTGMNLTTDIKTAGSHTIKVKVSDGKIEDSKDVIITVNGGSSGGSKGGSPGFELVGLIAAIGVAAVVVMRRRE